MEDSRRVADVQTFHHQVGVRVYLCNLRHGCRAKLARLRVDAADVDALAVRRGGGIAGTPPAGDTFDFSGRAFGTQIDQ